MRRITTYLKTFVLTCLLSFTALQAGAITLGELQSEGVAGTSYSVSATVVGVYARGFLMGDGTGYAIYYKGSATEFAVGDLVTVEGEISEYGGFKQFPAAATVTKTGTNVSFTQPTPEVYTGAKMDEYLSAPSFKYVKVTGTLGVSGNYYNLTVEGAATAIGSISYPIDVDTYKKYDKKVITVTGYAIGVSSSKYFNMMVVSFTSDDTPEEVTYTKVDVATAFSGAVNTNYEVDGTVCATYERGFLLNDATGSILVYTGTATTFVIGDIVNVKGQVTTYGGMNQFTGATVAKTGSGSFTQPTAVAMDSVAMIAYLTAPVIKYAKYSGVLTISGTYYNIALDGTTTAIGSIAYPSASLVPDSLNGKNVEVTGYLIGVSSSKYVNTMALSIKYLGAGGGGTGGDEGDDDDEITGVNLLANGGFETWQGDSIPTEWYANSASNATIAKSTDAKEGTYSVELTGATSNKRLSTKPYDLKAGKYTFAVHAKAAEGKTAGSIRIGYVSFKEDGSVNTSAYKYLLDKTAVTSTWKQYSGEFTFDTDTTVSLVIMISAGADTYYLADNAMLVSGGGTPVDPDPKDSLELQPIQSAASAAAGTECYVEGTVVAKSSRSFLINDVTGSILVYLGSTPSYSIGDIVTVKGAVSAYGGFNQFGNTAVVTLTGSNISFAQPTPAVMDGAALDAIVAAPAIKYISYTGVLSVSGNYYNVSVEGATTAIGSLTYPIDNYALNDNDTIKVTGYVVGISGSKYVNTIVVGFEVVGDYNEPTETEGEGTLENPYTVADVILLNGTVTDSAWVIGKVGGTYANGGALTTSEWTVASNIALVNAAGDAVPVQLPAESAVPGVRAALNLVDNPALFGETIRVFGKMEAYFSVPGVKGVTKYDLSDTGIQAVENKAGLVIDGCVVSGKGLVEIYNVVGQRVHTMNGGSITLSKGIYMIKSEGKVSKVFVK